MFDQKRSTILFGFALLLLLVSNIVVLTSVYLNRQGEPEATILLTERELTLKRGVNDESSGLVMRLEWRAYKESFEYYSYFSREPAWLNEEKLRELGFDVDKYKHEERRNSPRPLPKDVFVVLEKNSPLHAKIIRSAEDKVLHLRTKLEKTDGDKEVQRQLKRTLEMLEEERIGATRLFAIDAGLDPLDLRKAYPDRTRYIIASAIVRMGYGYSGKIKEVQGYIQRLSVSNIHLPVKFRSKIKALRGDITKYRQNSTPPRYQVRLAYGKKYEPWIVEIEDIEEQNK